LTRTGWNAKGLSVVMTIDWAQQQKAIEALWKQIKTLFGEHHFLTILCAFFAVMMTISFYRFLKSISPALVGFVLLLILFLLVLHWTQTRSEPAFMKPFIDWLAPFFPAPATTPMPVPKK
jgi:membrane-bound metal-dependent hydrolase YbcI (DUF457 family)